MAFVKEWSVIQNANHTVVTFTTPAGGCAVGDVVVFGIAYSVTSQPSIVVSSSVAGNTWRVTQRQEGTSGGAAQVSCKLAVALPAGSTVTITYGITVARSAGTAQHHDGGFNAFDTGAVGFANGVTGHPATASFSTAQASSLIIGTINFVSAGRTLTAGSGFTAGTKVSTTSGSGDRAVQMEYKYVAVTGSYLVNGTFNSSALWSAIGEAYSISGGGGGPAGPTLKRWDGSAFKTGGTIKRWDGSTFKTGATIRRWDGSAWHPAP